MRLPWTRKKRKRGQASIWLVVLPIAVSVLTYFWIAGAAIASQYPPRYFPPAPDSPQDPVSYTDLLDRHSINQSLFENLFARGIVAFGAHTIIFATLILFAEPKRSAVMLVLLAPGSLIATMGFCGGCAATTLPASHAQLDHIDTAAFDGHVYHLTLATSINSGRLDELYLFECDLSGEDCIYVTTVSWYAPVTNTRPENWHDARFVVDDTAQQLQVHEGGTMFFARDARTE